MRQKHKIILYLIVLFVFFNQFIYAQENFLFLAEGMPSVDFGSFDRNILTLQKTASIEVISSGTPYSFSAKVSGRFTNDEGHFIDTAEISLEVRSVFTGETDFMRSFPLAYSERSIYSSDDLGTSENFNLVFDLTIPANTKAGEYTGILNIIYYENDMEVEEEEIELTFKVNPFIEITLFNKQEMQTNDIYFKPLLSIGEASTEEFILSIETNLGKKYKVQQIIDKPFVNDRNGQQIDSPDFLTYRLAGEGLKGELYSTYQQDLSNSEELLYISNNDGESDRFRIFYYLTHLPQVVYGEYLAYLNFRVIPFDNSFDFSQYDLKNRISFEIKKILNIKVSPVEQSGRLDFGTILLKDKMVVKSVKVFVESNTGASYVVSQEFIQPIVNHEGHMFSENGRLFKTHGGKKGKCFVSDFITLPISKTDLYESDEDGSSDSFFVSYGISPFSGNVGGRYSTGIKYTVEEITK